MIEVVLVSSFFIVSLLIFIIIMGFGIKRWSMKRDDYYLQKHEDLHKEISDMKKSFIQQIDQTVANIKQFIDKN